MFRRFLMYGAVLALLVTCMNGKRNRAATESVRQPDPRHLRNAAARLMGWKVTARGDAFGQLSFSEATAKADAAGLAFVEGSSIQKVSPQISKNLDDNLSAEEAAGGDRPATGAQPPHGCLPCGFHSIQ